MKNFRYFVEMAATLVAIVVLGRNIDAIADVLDKFFQQATAIMLWLVSFI